MELVTTVITPVVESLMGVVKRHLSFCFYSTNNVRDMRARIEQLNNTARDMKTRKETNDAKNLVVPHHVPAWLAKVETICEEAGNVATGGIGCLNLKKIYEAGKQSSDILKDIDRLMKEKSEIEWSDEQRPLGRVLSTLPSTSEPVVVAAAYDDDATQTGLKSRDLIFQEAIKSLDPNNKIQKIALCGMGGVGKTTMMDQLKKAVEDNNLFHWSVKVVIGKSENLIAIQQRVAEYIGQPLTETQKDTRAERLRKSFVGMSEDGKKNILVILDDLWELVDLKDIGLTNPLPKGFKLLLTSREENVCTQMGVEASSIFRMVVLDEVEAKFLFWEVAGTVSDGNIDHDLHKIGEDIVKKCGGLPIAIKTIASTLRDNNVKDVWVDALERLQNKELSFVETVFKTSYENLKDDDEKATFLLSGLFPDDYNIPIEDLMIYGWGLKFFKNSKTIATARRRVKTCVNNLVRSNMLIQSDRQGCVKMHDLVRDFILSNFSNIKQASLVIGDDISEQLTKESYERILLKCTGMREFPADFNHPNLALLKLLDGDYLDTFPEDFYNRMEKLEVVAYDRMEKPLLPQYSTTLRTLCLRSCRSVGDISFIGDLINLEVLSFVFCGISKLPSAIGNLKKLKLLDLTGCVDLCIDDGVFHKLEKLRELYMSAYEGKPIRFTEDSCEGLKMLSSKLIALDVEFFESIIQPKSLSYQKLERFRISMGCQLCELSDFDYEVYENTLQLFVTCKELLECKINVLFRKTEILDLSVNEMSSLEQISMHPSQHSFCNLRVLYVNECADLTSVFTVNVASSLTKLERLIVWECPVLESLVQEGENSEAKVIKFHKLKILRLYDLPMFVSLCDTDQVMEFPQLVALRLEGLPNVTSIFSENNEICGTREALLKKKILIPNLEILYIWRMEKLKEIWSCENTTTISHVEVHNFSNLRVLYVNECADLSSIFTVNVASSLTKLEILGVSECPVLESLVQEGENSEAKVIKFPKLELLELRELPMFVSLCDTDQVMEFPQLVTLRLDSLPSVTSIFSENNEICGTREALLKKKILIPNLEKLKIDGMEKLKEIWSCENTTSISDVELHNFSNLRKIEVYFCDSVVNIFGCNWMRLVSHLAVKNGEKQQPLSLFHNLTTIDLRGCKSIKYLFSPLLATHLSNLKTIYIQCCEGMEEVVSNRDDNEDEQMTAPTTTTLFPHLDELFLESLPSLKHVGGGGVAKGTNNDINDQLKYSQVHVVCWSLCQYSREITVADCPAMSQLIPSHVAGQILMVEQLNIDKCIVMKEVFATTDIKNSGGLSSNFEERSGGTDTALAIPRLTSITPHKLSNLKTMDITNCNSLEHIFTFSTLESLTKLEEISISNCKAMKVIVREENGEQTVASKVVVFPRLKSIRLNFLPNLEGFFLGMSEFKWPLLDDVRIMRCPKMMAFTSSKSTAPKLKYIHSIFGNYSPEWHHFYVETNSPQTPSLSLKNGPLSLRDTIEVNVEDNDKIEEIFASNDLLQLPNLEKIHVKRCKWVKTVFEVESDSELNSKSQIVVKFPKLRQVDLEDLSWLKYIWKSNIQGMKLEFPNLTRLSIHKCDSLEYVFTSSMVGSLMQLQDLQITKCYNMEVIIKDEEDEENTEEECDGDGKVSEIIVFPCLKSLKLENLVRHFKGFYLGKDLDFSFPSLNTLVIKECPKLEIFTKGCVVTPELKVIETNLGLIDVGEQDINSFIITTSQEGLHFARE